MDRRLTPANARVVLRGSRLNADDRELVDGKTAFVAVSIVDLLTAPDGKRERQLLLGEQVTQMEDHNGWSFVQTASGYVGYIPSPTLTTGSAPTHFVSTLATHAYEASDMKTPELMYLSFGSRVTVLSEERKFMETSVGYVPKGHLRPLDRPLTDPAAAAQMLFGVPYLWGGNASLGIDCSGLVSAAFGASGHIVPGDSDLQEMSFGDLMPKKSDYSRGDLIFWDGHVAIVVDESTLIHANAHHMACRYEPITQAIDRIAAQGDGPVTAHRRVLS